MELIAGANTPLPTVNIALDIQAFGIELSALDFSAYLLASANNKVRGDDDMIFYGQIHNQNQTIKLNQSASNVTFQLDLARIDSQIAKIAICATLADETKNFSSLSHLNIKIKDSATLATAKITGQNRLEVALIIGEFYRHQQNWKFRLVAQGFNGGLKPLSEHFGVEIAGDAPQEQPNSNSSPPTISTPPISASSVSSVLKDIFSSPFKALEKRKKLKEFQSILVGMFASQKLTNQDMQQLINFCNQNNLSSNEALASCEAQSKNFLISISSKQPKDTLNQWGIFLQASSQTMQQVYAAIHRSNEDKFHDMLKIALSDGELTEQEIRNLEQFCQEHKLNRPELMRRSASIVKDFLNFNLASMVADKFIDQAEQTAIEKLCKFLNPEPSLVNEINATIQQVNKLANIRKGNVTPIQTNAIITKNSELVYWHQTNVSYWFSKNEHLTGDLFITNERIIFKAGKGLETLISNIIAIESNFAYVTITAKTKKGSGAFHVGSDAALVEAYIDQSVKRFHRQLDLQQTAGGTRHITQSVKNIVWTRCQGKCVQCASTMYLEFDHIIPFSKGGSNSENNIQILCRACNLAKSNQI